MKKGGTTMVCAYHVLDDLTFVLISPAATVLVPLSSVRLPLPVSLPPSSQAAPSPEQVPVNMVL